MEKWILDISDLHRSKPNPSVHYSKPMPDIDNLMQVGVEIFTLIEQDAVVYTNTDCPTFVLTET